MKVKDLMQLLHGPDRIRIIKNGNTIFAGWKDNWPKEYAEETICDFRAVPEIRHKEWETRGLLPPLEPDEMPDYIFSDLQMKLYHEIKI
ncbi:MAG: hypothetical protein E6124_04310 [Blautia producta]|uniref:hypothetical protein n=1 Tax=Blautia producta TaxID=33035 RepID=UPI0029108177|nr:hypothetical protein [Blautia producta]MDU5381403.1 hypothetical protein [Blautia producta]MDU6882476.1 hypothetical protein [Blautia producta]